MPLFKVGPDGQRVQLPADEEAAILAEWAANDAKPKERDVSDVEVLERAVMQKTGLTRAEIDAARDDLRAGR